MGCAAAQQWEMTRRTLPHPKPVPKTRTTKYGESLGRCNRPNTTSKGRRWLRCVFSWLLPLHIFKHVIEFALELSLLNSDVLEHTDLTDRFECFCSD